MSAGMIDIAILTDLSVRAGLDEAADSEMWLTDDEVTDHVKRTIAEAHAAQR